MYKLLIGVVAAVMLLAGVTETAMAAPAGTSISNSATVNYSVASIGQDPVNSAAATFLVDRKVDFTVVTDESAVVSVTPGTSANVLRFTVDNTGNDTFDFDLAAIDLSGASARFGGNDNINASAIAVYVDANANDTYEAATDIATSIDDLAAGSNVTVFIVSTFALGLSDDDIASYYLRATANDSSGAALSDDSGSSDITGTVQNVFATDDGPAPTDGNLDVIDSDYADYQVNTATISVTKTSTVISDPVSGTSNPKAIPGAVIEYTLTISNAAGSATATSITVSDSLNTEIATNGYLAFNTQYDATAGRGINIGHPDYSSGTETEYTNANDGSEFGGVSADWNVIGTNVVTVSGITLDASESATVKFRVTVQ